MRKYKQIKRKEIIFSIDEWKTIEDKAASVLMKTGTFIKRMSLDGHITYFNMSEVGEVMKALLLGFYGRTLVREVYYSVSRQS